MTVVEVEGPRRRVSPPVKTLGPSDPDAGYARTRRFYEPRGFVPLEEPHDLWEDNPCLLLVKRL